MDSTIVYSNGLNYVPYTSKRHSRQFSFAASDAGSEEHHHEPSLRTEAELTHAAGLPSRPSSSSSSPISSRVASPQPPTTAIERPVFTTLPPGGSTFRRVGVSKLDSSPASPSPLRPRVASRRPPLILGTPSTTPAESIVSRQLPGSSTSTNAKTSPGSQLTSLPEPTPTPPPAPSLPEATTSRNSTPLPSLPSSRSETPPVITAANLNTPSVLSKSPSPAPRLTAAAPSAATQKAPYRPGFQPRGAYNDRTDEFIGTRNSRPNLQRGEERRLERRLEKLLNLYFPLETPGSKQSPLNSPKLRGVEGSQSESPSASPSRRLSSFFEFLDLKGKGPSDLIRGALEPKPGTPAALRATEQVITHWQDDAFVTACPICRANFHPLINRKHHCRLCGRVICALPATPPPKDPSKLHVRPKPCSSLITLDPITGRVVEVPESIAYGVTKRPALLSTSTTAPGTSASDVGDRTPPKSFRVCRDCSGVISRKELHHESHTVTTFTRLYHLLLRVEGDIETHLSTLEGLLPAIILAPANSEAMLLRKQLSQLFTDYDAIAKKIRSLPCVPSSSQDRVQQAVWMRGLNFMQMNIGLFQRMPKPSTHQHNKSASLSDLSVLNGEKLVNDLIPPQLSGVQTDSALAHSLQPLLEQEALLESFIQEASAQRKFEDVKSLKANLTEIRSEINRMASASNIKI